MIKFLSLVVMVVIALQASAQKKKKTEEKLLSDQSEWFEGSIMLSEGDELQGLVKYNDRNGVLSYQNGNENKVFTAMRVVAFEFFDERIQKQRLFYTFEYEDSETNVMRPLFFEVMKEYKTFAILWKPDRVEIAQKAGQPTGFISGPGTLTTEPIYPREAKLVIKQTGTIYLMKSTGEIKPYFKEVNEDDGQKSLILAGRDTKTKNIMLDRDLLEEFISATDYEKLKAYALKSDLKFKIKDEFLKIMDYYNQLIAE